MGAIDNVTRVFNEAIVEAKRITVVIGKTMDKAKVKAIYSICAKEFENLYCHKSCTWRGVST